MLENGSGAGSRGWSTLTAGLQLQETETSLLDGAHGFAGHAGHGTFEIVLTHGETFAVRDVGACLAPEPVWAQ